MILGVILLGVLLLGPDGSSTPATSGNDWKPEVESAPVSLSGAGSIEWSLTFGSPLTDWVNKVIRLSNGDFVAAGFIHRDNSGPAEWDGFATRFSADGRTLWTKRFGGPGLDALWSVKETPEGRLALVGFSATESGGDTDLWLLVLDHDGEPVLERRFGGSRAELGFDVVLAEEGGFLLIGQTESLGAGERDVFLVRADAGGQERWRRTYGGPEVDRGFYGVATGDGGFVVAGVTGPQGAYDMLILKIDAEGNELWRQTIGGKGNDPSHGINLLPDGRIVVVGYTQSWDSTEHDLMAVTLSSDGDVLRQELLGGPRDDRVINSITAADGGTWLVGYTRSFGDGDWDVMVARLTVGGRFEPWMGALGTAFDDHATTTIEAGDGTLIIGGYTLASSDGARPEDLLIFKVKPGSIERRTGVLARSFPAPGSLTTVGPNPDPLFVSTSGCGTEDLETWLAAHPDSPASGAHVDGENRLGPLLAEYRRLAAAAGARHVKVMDRYIDALNRHSVDDQYAFFTTDMEYVDEGVRIRPDTEKERADREFEGANAATWSYSVVGAALHSLEMIITEDMEFYRLLGVGPRSHRACYRFRNGKIAQARAWDWAQVGRPYRETRDLFVAWLLEERPQDAARVAPQGRLLFTGESAAIINGLVREWREITP